MTSLNDRNEPQPASRPAAAGNPKLVVMLAVLLVLVAVSIVQTIWQATHGPSDGEFLPRMAIAGIFVNLALAVLNLVPVPPLDGGRIVNSLLPARLAARFSRLEPYGLFILLGLLATGALGFVVAPLVDIGVGVIAALFSLSD